MTASVKPPVWFWIISVLGFLWNLMGVAAFINDIFFLAWFAHYSQGRGWLK